jgi:hypothetical protein
MQFGFHCNVASLKHACSSVDFVTCFTPCKRPSRSYLIRSPRLVLHFVRPHLRLTVHVPIYIDILHRPAQCRLAKSQKRQLHIRLRNEKLPHSSHSDRARCLESRQRTASPRHVRSAGLRVQQSPGLLEQTEMQRNEQRRASRRWAAACSDESAQRAQNAKEE